MKQSMKRILAFVLVFVMVLSVSWTDVLAETVVEETTILETQVESDEEIVTRDTPSDSQSEEILNVDPIKTETTVVDASVPEASTESDSDLTESSEEDEPTVENEPDVEDASAVKAASAQAFEASTVAPNYLTFYAREEYSSISFSWLSGENVQYSMDQGVTWSDYTKGSIIPLRYVGTTVCFKANNIKTGADDNGTIQGFRMTGTISASGSITSLTDGIGSNPNVTLKSQCYAYMFYNCTSLTTAPDLPATSLAFKCYYYMFNYCSNLTTVPSVLPATSLAINCYQGMFAGCEKLNTCPSLPATTLEFGCYQDMFGGCINLKKAPDLPATTLADYCYDSMFSGCSSLTMAPSLKATVMKTGCYRGMFSVCRSLSTAPYLPATTMAYDCYNAMFSDCTSLTAAPDLPATTLAKSCYYNMFYGCTSLTTAPDLPATTLVEFCYYSMFYGCTSLTTAPDLPATTLADYCYDHMFYNCSNLREASDLPATSLAVNCYYSMFFGCTSLTAAPDLPATILTPSCYEFMFGNCRSLVTTPALPAMYLAKNCYKNMFWCCKSLTTVPSLPATVLTESCYQDMFYGCSNIIIKTIKTDVCNLPWRIPATQEYYSLYDMFGNCDLVEFGSEPALNTTYYIQAPPTIEVTEITLNKSTLYLPAGQTSTLTAHVLPAHATDKTITWTSSNTAVATVSSTGLIKGIKRGTAKITAKTSNGKAVTCTVTVGFSDVPANAWYLSTVNWAVNKKITSGIGSSGLLFKPDDVCSRAQIVTFLWNAAGQPSVKGIANPFTDVKSTDWYYSAVLWAVSKKITNGTTATTFSPNAECTRAQVVTFLWNWAGQPKTSNTVAFTDVKTTAYYYPAVKWAVYAKVTNGKNATTFAPEEKCTRAQVVTFLYNYFGGK